jgi:hypothetical protein
VTLLRAIEGRIAGYLTYVYKVEYSRKRVYYSISQGEFDYQLYSSIRVIVLWQSAKKHQNCVDDDQITNLQPTKLPSNHHQ